MAYKDADRRRAHIRADYQKNRVRRLAQIRRRERATLDWIRSLKVQCGRCPENDPACLDFHHRDATTKDISIAKAALRGWSRERILKEIEKCDVLCANCHRKLHYWSG